MEYGLNGGQGALKRGYIGMASSAARVRSTATWVGWHPGIIKYKLDEKIQAEYEEYLAEVNTYSERFRGLIDKAFTPGIRNSLMKSAELARAAGVKEEELLTSIEDVDNFFLN